MKALYAGAGLALTAGLLLGGAMKPTFAADGRPEGPQVFQDWTGAKPTGPFDSDAGLAAYKGAVPDYVTGTDYKVAWADPPRQARAPHSEAVEAPVVATGDEVGLDPGVYSGGDMDQDPALAADPPMIHPPAPTPDVGAEAPPEATGDTTRAAG